MNILYPIDYYPPFTPGGSEWSIYYLSSELSKHGIQTLIVTPNYGAKSFEILNKIPVVRFPFYKKLSNFRQVVNPIWQNNPIFFIWSAYYLIRIIKKQNIDIVHVNGKYLVPGSIIAAKLTNRPVIISIRDKQLLCSLGRCFFEKGRYKACGWREYLSEDLKWFVENYVNDKSLLKIIYIFIGVVWTRLANQSIKYFAKKADRIVAISISQKRYLEHNGFSNVLVIYNNAQFGKLNQKNMKKGVLYAGKLSLGKGVYELLKAIKLVTAKHHEIFYFAGGIDDKNKISQIVAEDKIDKFVKLLGGVDHKKLMKLYQQVKVVIQPSIYPEAFGRVALEALSVGTPTVVSNRGALPEIVTDKETGAVSDVSSESLAKAINYTLENNHKLRSNIIKDLGKLREKFEIKPIQDHIKLYKLLVKKNNL